MASRAPANILPPGRISDQPSYVPDEKAALTTDTTSSFDAEKLGLAP